MKRILALLCFAACTAPEAPMEPTGTAVPTVQLDRETAGADPYGMRSYVIAFLKTGPNRSATPEEAAALQTGHMKNIERMAEAGQLVLAGPFLDGQDFRGLYVFATASPDTARVWTSTDPAVAAGLFDLELHPWYGSAALIAVNDLHHQLAEKSITE